MEYWKAVQGIADRGQAAHVAYPEVEKQVMVMVNGHKAVDINDIVLSETIDGLVLLKVDVRDDAETPIAAP